MKRALVALAPVLVACSSPSGPTTTCGAAAAALSRPLLVLEHGDQTSSLAKVSGGCLTESSPDPVLGRDDALLEAHGVPFVAVNDDGSLRKVDPDALRITQTFAVYPDHPSSACFHGIYGVDADASGDLWVSRDDVGEVAVIAPDGALAARVDLSKLDPDGQHPDMNGILVTGGYAYVALGFLTHGDGGCIASDTARRKGMIAVIDTSTREVRQIDLVGHNPVRKLIPIDATGTKIIVATPGKHDVKDAGDGIDLVDLTAGTATQLASEDRLGGSVDEVVWAGPHEVYAITLGDVPAVNPTRVIVFDPATQDAPRVLAQAPWFTDHANGAAYVHVGLALDGDLLVVGDRTPGAEGIRLFRRSDGTEVLPPIRPGVEAPWGLLPHGP